MVKSINDIGHVMGKTTVAEFVENQATFDKLKETGVDYAQGYLVGKPRPIDEACGQSLKSDGSHDGNEQES